MTGGMVVDIAVLCRFKNNSREDEEAGESRGTDLRFER